MVSTSQETALSEQDVKNRPVSPMPPQDVTRVTETPRRDSYLGSPRNMMPGQLPGKQETDSMGKPLGWARVKPPGSYMLRRGAWYPVVLDNRYQLVVLGVGDKNVAVPRDRLSIRHHLPSRFSVVRREAQDFNPVKDTPHDLGLQYAVCPASRSRVRISGHPEKLECPVCGYRENVAWEDSC